MSRALPFVSSFAFRDARGIASLGEDICLIFFLRRGASQKARWQKSGTEPTGGLGMVKY